MKKSVKNVLLISIYIWSVLFLVYLMVSYVGRRIVVDGSSMEPALSNQDNVMIDKITYSLREPERFDIIVVTFQYQPRITFIKRIIGLPGETVFINEEGFIYIDGELLSETYGIERITPENIGLAAVPITLGENEYFVLGDNRNDSLDSRNPAIGNIKREDIVGKAWSRVWPLAKFGLLKHG